MLDFGLVEPAALEPVPVKDAAVPTEVIGDSVYFHTERLQLAPGQSWHGSADGRTLEIWGTLRGSALLHWQGESLPLPAISWVLVPAALGEFHITAAEDSVLLRVITP